MNRADDHVLFEELAVGHALSALEPEDEHVFLDHLANCARCEREVAEHRETVALLAYAADPAEPPPSVLEGIRAGLLPAAGDVTAGPASAPVRTVRSDDQPPRATPITVARRRQVPQPRALRWTGLAAAAALVVALAGWNVSLRADRASERQLSQQLAAAVRELGRPDARSVPLAADDGQVVAVAVVHDREMSLVTQGLAPNDADTTYVLWAQDRQGGLRAVRAFDVGSERVAVLNDLPVREGVDGVQMFALSREPGDDAPAAPAGPVVASGQA